MMLTVRSSKLPAFLKRLLISLLFACGHLTSCWIESVTNLIFKLYFLFFFLNWLSYIKEFEVANRPGLSADLVSCEIAVIRPLLILASAGRRL